MIRWKVIATLACWLTLTSAAAFAQLPKSAANPTATRPSDTDSRISTFNDPHISWLPTTKSRNQLLVFLPGTGGKPKEQFSFAETGAALGYHVIALMYPDNIAAQKKCSGSPDPQAYTKFRMAIIEGGDIGPHRHIDRADSIETRLTQLLNYLDGQQPDRGWRQFLNANKKIAWNKVVIAGHSQGGGHAYMIAKIHKVARVITFGSPKDYSFYFNRPAQGFDADTQTPLNRYFAFNHMQDNGHGCSHAQQMEILKQMGVLQLGIANADKPSPNYNHAHIIFTDVPLPNPVKYHGSVLNETLPVCAPVWKYMLTEPVQ